MSKVRIAMIGCGGIQGKHLNTLSKRDDAEIVALCDNNPEQIQRFLDKHVQTLKSEPPRFTDLTAMYDKVKPDAVIISTPHTLHFEHGMQALDHGCHVLMEKPMVTNADHAYQLAEKVEQTGKVFVIGYNTPCSPEFQYLRQVVRTGELGKLELVVAYLSQGWMKGTAGSWRQDPTLSGGGQAYDSGAHPLNSLCWTVESRVAEVFAFIDNCGTPVDINSSINIRFENGVFAAMAISGNCPSMGSHMALMFDNGRVEIDPWLAKWIRVFKGGEPVKYPPITGEPTDPADNFIDAILGKAEPRTSPRNGIVHSELMDAIYESARTGQPAHPKARPGARSA